MGFDLLSGENLGAILIAFSISLILFGIIVIQAYTYYLDYPNDRVSLKILATAILILETAHSIATIYMMYQDLIIRRGFSPNGPNSYALASTYIPSTLVTALVQGFFIIRIYRLSGTRLIYGLFLPVLLNLGGGLAFLIEAFIDVSRVPNTVTIIYSFGWIPAFNFIVGAIADVIITVFLCFYLKRLAPGEQPASTSHLINGLLLYTIRTGTITSITSIAIAVTCYIKPWTEIWYALYIVITKLYSNSFFLSLNMRHQLREMHAPGLNISGIQFKNKATISGSATPQVYNTTVDLTEVSQSRSDADPFQTTKALTFQVHAV